MPEEVTVTVESETPEPELVTESAPSVVVIDTGDSTPSPTPCEHTDRIMNMETRLVALETRPEPEPVIIEAPAPEPEPIVEIEPDVEPDRGHPWFTPIGNH